MNWKPMIISALVALSACGRTDVSRIGDSTAAAAATRAWEDAGTAMANRGEAQEYLDIAREAFLANDERFAAPRLRAAADITRRHAADATEPAASALRRSADELEAMATRMMDDGLSSVAPLDSAFARLHLAEAQYHCLRAEAAWGSRQPGLTGAEMLMLADHFERAARDVGYRLTPPVTATLSTLRSVGVMLPRTGLTKSPEVAPALSTMDKAVHDLMALVGDSRF